MKTKNILIIASVMLILIGVKLTFLKPKNQAKSGSPGAMGKSAPSNVTAFITSASTLDNQLFSFGTVRAYEEVMLMPEVAGKLTQINFKEGTNVSKGSLLAKISDVDLQAQLSKLNLQLKLAKEREARLKSMIEIKGVSQEELDGAINLVNTINADIEFCKAQIAKTEVRAPFDGQIGLRQVSEGSFVNSATVIASIQQTKLLKIDFTVPEKYAAIVVPGNIVKFTVDNINQTFTAKVDAVEPKIDEQTRNITIRAVFNNEGGRIYPGAFARIELSANKKQEAILIPTEAIIPELKGKKVFVNRSGKAIPVKVKTGLRNDVRIEITEGLKVGDTVITTGIMTLKPEAEIIITQIKK
jgi:membrane fusion protein (multidrug efflux system)